MSTIIAAFAVYGGTAVEFELDVEGMTDQEIAEAVEEASGEYLDTSLCHQCAHNISDPEAGELTGLTVDGRDIDVDEPASETVTISRADYERLTKADEELGALHAAGVDNWEGYDEAVRP
jgi:hypothetical protein